MVTSDSAQADKETQPIIKKNKRERKYTEKKINKRDQKKIFSRGNQGNATASNMMFFLKRTGIRGMGKYYRKKYEVFRAKYGIKLALKDIKNLEELKEKMTNYVQYEFGTEKIAQFGLDQLIMFLIVVICNDRVEIDKQGNEA